MSSILKDVKQIIGLNIDYEDPYFDPQLIIHINSVFSILNQLGIGKYGYFIKDESQEWEEFIDTDQQDLNLQDIKTYVSLKTKMIFDPPNSSTVMQSFDNIIKELEWRLSVEKERSIKEKEKCTDITTIEII